MKQQNEYSLMIKTDHIPKAVLAAIVVSEYLNRLGVSPNDLQQAIEGEWDILYKNGIVPQRPIRLTPVAGDGAGGSDGDVEGETRPAPEHDG